MASAAGTANVPILKEVEALLDGVTRVRAAISPDRIVHKHHKGGKVIKPVLGKTVQYVVCVVVFNEKDELLMTREGFHPCYGQWYLPAGRVDPKETLVDAAIREVREETGLEFVPQTLLVVESPQSTWHRFTFSGIVTGGKLRTQTEQDSETLEAGWWQREKVLAANSANERPSSDPLKEFVLRGRDIIKLVQIGHTHATTGMTKRHDPLLPSFVSLDAILVRLMLICGEKNQTTWSVLAWTQDEEHIPILTIDLTIGSILSPINRLIQEVTRRTDVTCQLHGLLGVEHNGREPGHDGLCLTVLATVRPPGGAPPTLTDPKYRWRHVDDPRVVEMCTRRMEHGMTIPLLVK